MNGHKCKCQNCSSATINRRIAKRVNALVTNARSTVERELVDNPAKSEAQRKYLNSQFGHEWVKEHHFDNRGELPEKVENDDSTDDVQPVAVAPPKPKAPKKLKPLQAVGASSAEAASDVAKFKATVGGTMNVIQRLNLWKEIGKGLGLINPTRPIVNSWSKEAREASAAARKSGDPADHLHAAKLHLRDSKDSGDSSHVAAKEHIAAAGKLIGNAGAGGRGRIVENDRHEQESFEDAEDELDEDDAAAQIVGSDWPADAKDGRHLDDVDEDGDPEHDEGGEADDHQNPKGVTRPKPPVKDKGNLSSNEKPRSCKHCGGELNEDGKCDECGTDADVENCDATDNSTLNHGAFMNPEAIEKLMELPFIVNSLNTSNGRKQFAAFVGNMPAGGAFSGAKDAGYSPAQAAAMAGKLEGSYSEQSQDHHMKGRAAEKASEHADKTKSKSAHKKAATAHKEAGAAHKEAGNEDSSKYHATKSRSHAQKAARMTRNEATVNALVEDDLLTHVDAAKALATLNANGPTGPDSSFSDVDADEDDTTEESEKDDEVNDDHGWSKTAKKQVGKKSPATMNAAQIDQLCTAAFGMPAEQVKQAVQYTTNAVKSEQQVLVNKLTQHITDPNLKKDMIREYGSMNLPKLRRMVAAMPPVRNAQEDDQFHGTQFGGGSPFGLTTYGGVGSNEFGGSESVRNSGSAIMTDDLLVSNGLFAPGGMIDQEMDENAA